MALSIIPIGTKVQIVGAETIEGVITAACVRGTVHLITYEISWFMDGSKSAWFQEIEFTTRKKQKAKIGFNPEQP